jgi:hypothetical protein
MPQQHKITDNNGASFTLTIPDMGGATITSDGTISLNYDQVQHLICLLSTAKRPVMQIVKDE